MVMSPTNYCHNFSGRKNTVGLTLIEILIALAIVGIALTAVIKATSENIRSTTYLQNKIIAMWVGKQVLNETRVGILTLPNDSDKLKQTSNVLGRNWYWQASQEITSNNRIRKIEVQVFASEEEEESPLIHLEGYVYRED